MRRGSKNHRPPYTVLLIGALAILLVLLAVFQYQWMGQVSIGERETLRAAFRSRASSFREEINREIGRVNSILEKCAELLLHQREPEVAEVFDRWNQSVPYPEMVKGLFFARRDKEGLLELSQFNKISGRFEPLDWPSDFASLRALYDRSGLSEEAERERKRMIEKRMLEESTPALVELLERSEPREQVKREAHEMRGEAYKIREEADKLAGLIIITLDRDYLKQTFIPALAGRSFADNSLSDYDLIVFNNLNPKDVIYKSGEINITDSTEGDEAAIRFSLRLGSLTAFERENWQVLIKSRASALDQAVAKARNRNLAISFGILTLLATSMIIIIINARRAQRLARRQMEFVAGVSHEFRTPLSVIHALSENLADGLIIDRRQVEQCGEVIRNDVRRLASMVEQVLEFAGASRVKGLYQTAPVDLCEIIDEVLARYSIVEGQTDLRVEKEIETDLPRVLADRAALESALRNILDNAVKYGGPHQWIGIKGRFISNGQGPSVQLSIKDKGVGIPASDLPFIFEPFYRGREVLAAQIHGNGLGLSLVKNIIEAHGGTITVESRPGEGTCFTMNLPAASKE